MNLKEKLGNKIKALRLHNNLTQEALAEKINISAKSLSQIELGNNFVSAETLEKICLALDIKPKSLFNFDYSVDESKDILDIVINKLKKNNTLLSTIYKIIMALDD